VKRLSPLSTVDSKLRAAKRQTLEAERERRPYGDVIAVGRIEHQIHCLPLELRWDASPHASSEIAVNAAHSLDHGWQALQLEAPGEFYTVLARVPALYGPKVVGRRARLDARVLD